MSVKTIVKKRTKRVVFFGSTSSTVDESNRATITKSRVIIYRVSEENFNILKLAQKVNFPTVFTKFDITIAVLFWCIFCYSLRIYRNISANVFECDTYTWFEKYVSPIVPQGVFSV